MNAEQPPAVARHVDQLDSIEQVAQDSELDRALHIEEFDGIEELLDAGPNDREPPVLSRTRRRLIAHKPRRGPHISTDAQSHSPARTTAPTPSYASGAKLLAMDTDRVRGRCWRYSRHRNPLPHPVKAPCRFCPKCATALSNSAPLPLTAQDRGAAAVPRCAKGL